MSESYFGRCGMCVHCNLFDKGSISGKFYCLEKKYYVRANEERCKRFENDNRRTYEDIELAREGKLYKKYSKW